MIFDGRGMNRLCSLSFSVLTVLVCNVGTLHAQELKPLKYNNPGLVVDLQAGMGSLINKVRPLVGHEGALVVINNAVFVSGAEYKALLDALCADGYLALETVVDVPPDCTGYSVVGTPPTDPAPFNHSTKIAILRATRKDGRRAGDDPSSGALRAARRGR